MAAEATGRRGSESEAPGPRDQSSEPAALTLGEPGLHRHVNSEVRPRQRGLEWRAASERAAAASRAAGPGGPVRLKETARPAAGDPGGDPASAPLAAVGGAQATHTPPHLAHRGLRR